MKKKPKTLHKCSYALGCAQAYLLLLINPWAILVLTCWSFLKVLNMLPAPRKECYEEPVK